MTHKQWLRSFTRDNLSTIAKHALITPSTLYRQVESNTLSFESVARIAHAYRQNIGASLIQCGLLAGSLDVDPVLSSASNDELLDEIESRMKP